MKPEMSGGDTEVANSEFRSKEWRRDRREDLVNVFDLLSNLNTK